jgi:hypothetical protein
MVGGRSQAGGRVGQVKIIVLNFFSLKAHLFLIFSHDLHASFSSYKKRKTWNQRIQKSGGNLVRKNGFYGRERIVLDFFSLKSN